MESDIIKISHLTKNFSEVKAVNDLNFKVKRGELFAFLGVNGAGKSTTISIICGQLHKDSGSVEIDGVAAEKLGNKLGKKLGIVFLVFWRMFIPGLAVLLWMLPVQNGEEVRLTC